MDMLRQEIADQLLVATGHRPQIGGMAAVGGGDINRCYRVDTSEQVFFVKINSAALADMFFAEAAALDELSQCAALETPRVIGVGNNQDRAFLILSYLELRTLDANIVMRGLT